MKTIKFKNIEQLLEITPGEIYNISILNPTFLYTILIDIRNFDNEKILYYNNDIIDVSKHSIFIDNILSLELNNKKSLTQMYKLIEKDCIGENEKEIFAMINSYYMKLIDSISLQYDIPLTYNDNLEIHDIISIASLKCRENSDFFDNLISFIKSTKLSNNFCILFSLNLLDFLTNEEILLFKKEIEYLNITIINISSHIYSNNVDKNIIIDEDLCEIC